MKFWQTALWAGVVATSAAASPTLVNIPDIQSSEMREHFSPEQWRMLEKVPYVAYVHLIADVDDSGKLRRPRVEAASPGDAWPELAKSRLGKVVISAANIGSHIKPQAKVWVVFYGPAKDDPPNSEKLMIIYAQPAKYVKPIAPGQIGERTYLESTTYK